MVHDGAAVDRKERDPVDWKLELVTVPVSDVDRAEAFYVERAGREPVGRAAAAPERMSRGA